MQAQLPNMGFFSFREQGTSVGKKHDGGCRKELAAVSVSCTMKKQVLVPLMSRKTWPVSAEPQEHHLCFRTEISLSIHVIHIIHSKVRKGRGCLRRKGSVKDHEQK